MVGVVVVSRVVVMKGVSCCFIMLVCCFLGLVGLVW